MVRRHLEDSLQRAVVQLLQLHENQGHLRYAAVPNGEKRDAITGAKLKRLGVKACFPDLIVAFVGTETQFWELKAPKGRLTPEQKQWAEWFGDDWRIIRSIDDAQQFIREAIQ